MPSDDAPRRWKDIVGFCDSILAYTAGMSFGSFAVDSKTVDACCYCLLKIAEAASKLGPEAASMAPQHEWKQMRGLGNRLRHDYDNINLFRIWSTIEKDIFPLRNDAARVLANFGEASSD